MGLGKIIFLKVRPLQNKKRLLYIYSSSLEASSASGDSSGFRFRDILVATTGRLVDSFRLAGAELERNLVEGRLAENQIDHFPLDHLIAQGVGHAALFDSAADTT